MLKRHIPQKRKKGQSTVEYIILVAAVIAVLIVFLRPGGPFAKALNSTLDSQTNSMISMANSLADTHKSPTNSD